MQDALLFLLLVFIGRLFLCVHLFHVLFDRLKIPVLAPKKQRVLFEVKSNQIHLCIVMCDTYMLLIMQQAVTCISCLYL